MPVKHTQFKDKRITVMGLGFHGGGAGAARFFVQQGAKVTVTDLKTEKELAPSLRALWKLPIRYVLGKHRKEDFIKTDLVIQNPGVPDSSPYLALARKHHIPVDTDIGIFFELVPRGQIIGVTGTKGKSTTASLIAALLKTKYPRTVLAGNIRTSVFDVLPMVKAGAPVVLELSSWQLEGLAYHKKSPHVAVVTNILQDHLNRYNSFHQYIEAKANILRFQGAHDYAFLNEKLRQYKEFKNIRNKTRQVFFSWRQISSEYVSAWRLPGLHNLSNLAGALEVARLYKIPKKDVRRALQNFRGLSGRLECIRTLHGIDFYNDTTATAPDATIAALKSFPDPRRVMLIAGGTDKNLDYRSLGQFLEAYPPKAVIFLPGTATKKLESRIRDQGSRKRIFAAHSMQEAIRKAWGMAERGDVVLLSPGAASFGLFQHEFDRGEQFVKAVSALESKTKSQNAK